MTGSQAADRPPDGVGIGGTGHRYISDVAGCGAGGVAQRAGLISGLSLDGDGIVSAAIDGSGEGEYPVGVDGEVVAGVVLQYH